MTASSLQKESASDSGHLITDASVKADCLISIRIFKDCLY